MSSMGWKQWPRRQRPLRFVRLGSLVLAASWLPAAALAAEPLARVVGVQGHATAQRPGEPERSLRCNDPVYPGDRIETAAGASVGLLAGQIWTGLEADGLLALGATEAGAPHLDLRRGHLRVLDEGGAHPARLETPGLLAHAAGGDSEALVFAEKAGAVSMLCPYDAPLAVTRVGRGDGARPEPGQCAVAKPREPVYLAPSSHPRVALLDDVCPLSRPLAANVADRFSAPADVALGPPDVGTGPGFAPPIDSLRNTAAVPVAGAGAGSGGLTPPAGGGRLGTNPFPFIPPPAP